VSVLLGQGDGTFAAELRFAAGTSPGAVAVVDVNGDGSPDLVVAYTTSNDVSVLLQRQQTSGTSQIRPNDPDVGQTVTFAVTTPPVHGTASVDASGLVMYTPTLNFTGSDSLVVTVTDNGTPPMARAVTIAVTVMAP
jgi:VCBS repeat-containing protein